MYSITSRKGNVGVSTIGLVVADLLSMSTNNNILLVDLTFNTDLKKLLEAKTGTLDNLLNCNSEDEDIFEKILNDNIKPLGKTGRLEVLPGTRSKREAFLVKNKGAILDLLEKLEEIYDIVIVDMSYKMYKELCNIGYKSTTFNVIVQDISCFNAYTKDSMDEEPDTIYVLNKYRSSITPEESHVRDRFGRNLIRIDYDEEIPNLMNRKDYKFAKLQKSTSLKGFLEIAKIMSGKTSVKVKKKKSIFSRLFGR